MAEKNLRSNSLICGCLRIKKKEVRRMPVKFKPLRAICSSEASQEISSSLFRFSDFCHSSNHHYEVHPIGGETEESHHEYTCRI